MVYSTSLSTVLSSLALPGQVMHSLSTVCATLRSARPLLRRSMCLVATVAAGLMADTDLDVGSQQVSCGTVASASSRPSFAGNSG